MSTTYLSTSDIGPRLLNGPIDIPVLTSSDYDSSSSKLVLFRLKRHTEREVYVIAPEPDGGVTVEEIMTTASVFTVAHLYPGELIGYIEIKRLGSYLTFGNFTNETYSAEMRHYSPSAFASTSVLGALVSEISDSTSGEDLSLSTIPLVFPDPLGPDGLKTISRASILAFALDNERYELPIGIFSRLTINKDTGRIPITGIHIKRLIMVLNHHPLYNRRNPLGGMITTFSFHNEDTFRKHMIEFADRGLIEDRTRGELQTFLDDSI